MNLKKLALVAAAGTTLLAAAPVFAQSRYDHRDRWSGPSHGWRAPAHRPHYSYYRARGYYMPPPPVYYTPEPVYYTPPYYAPRAPVIYGRIPLGHHSSIGFSLPLN
jgi:hypothetical protein